MKNNKIYLLAFLVSIGLVFNSCDVNTEEYSAVSPVDSFVTSSTSVVVDSDAVSLEVVVATSEAYTADRSIPIEISDASTGSGLDYNFSGSVDIVAGALTGSTTLKFNFDPIPADITKDLVLRLVSTSEEITISYTKICQSNDVELTIIFDNFPGETSWDITDSSSSVVESGVGASTPFNGTFTLPDGDYTFTIYDSFGDGICCSWGNGSFELTKPACSETLGLGGTFASSDSVTFSLP